MGIKKRREDKIKWKNKKSEKRGRRRREDAEEERRKEREQEGVEEMDQAESTNAERLCWGIEYTEYFGYNLNLKEKERKELPCSTGHYWTFS